MYFLGPWPSNNHNNLKAQKAWKGYRWVGSLQKIKKSKFEGEIYYIDSKKKRKKKHTHTHTHTPILRKGWLKGAK